MEARITDLEQAVEEKAANKKADAEAVEPGVATAVSAVATAVSAVAMAVLAVATAELAVVAAESAVATAVSAAPIFRGLRRYGVWASQHCTLTQDELQWSCRAPNKCIWSENLRGTCG